MLNKEQKVLIAKLLKIPEAEFIAAIDATEEVAVTIDDKLTVLTETEVTTLKANSYKDGKNAGPEMEVDKLKKELGLEFTGKTVKALVEAAQAKTLEEAKVEPDQKVKELEGKLKTAQTTAEEFKTKLAEKENEINTTKTESLVLKDLPANTTLPSNKVLALMKLDGYEYKNEEGKIVWYKDGKVLADKIGNNLETAAVATEYVTTNKLLGEEDVQGGRGGGDKTKKVGVFTKLSEVKAKFEAEGKNVLGDEFRQAVEEASKVEGFDMNA